MTARDLPPKVLDLAPIPRMLKSNLGLTFALLAGLMFGGQLLATLVTSTPLYEAGPGIGFLEDISTALDFAVLYPLILVLLLRFFRQIEGFLARSIADGVISLEGSGVEKQLAYLSNRWILIGFAVAALLLTIAVRALQIGDTLAIEGYFAVEAGRLNAAGLVMVLITVVSVFLIWLGFLRALFWLGVLRTIFAGTVRVDVMHPDGRGGLREAGAICMTFNYALFAVAIVIGLFAFTDAFMFQNVASARVLIMAPAYFIITPISFFFSLVPIHHAMARERGRHLKNVSERFNRLFKVTQSQDLETDEERKQLSDRVKVMKDLQEMYSWISRLPTWPINTPMYIRFSLSLLLPLIAYGARLVATDFLQGFLAR